MLINIDTYSCNIQAHIKYIEKYHIIVSIGVEDNVMHTVSW